MHRNLIVLRRLLIEQLSERIAFHAGEMELDSSLLTTPDGLEYYYDPPVDPEYAQRQLAGPAAPLNIEPNTNIQPDTGIEPGIPLPVLDVPKYHSNPSYPKKIYLDFDGHLASGTSWNNRVFTGTYNTGATINAPAFSLDSDLLNFSAAELSAIQEVWARVSEDYASFQVDVTTEEPPASLFTAGSQAIRAVITTDFDATTGQQWYANAGGVAFLNSWTSTNASPCWVFYNRLASFPKYISEAASHEVGHTFNLSHDGRNSPAESYYQGHGSGATAWAPIMGVGYYSNLTQWSKGEYTSANNTQDDLAIINSKLAYIPDDHGDTTASATQLNVGTASTLAASGLITTRTDVDAIRFGTQAGSITLNVEPFDYSTSKADLDAKITLLDNSGTVVGTVDNVNTINSTLTVNVAKGFYTLLVDGSSRPAVTGDDGYSDYASIGKYSVSGTIVANAAPTVVNDTVSIAPTASLLIDVLANDSDANNDSLTILSVGTPSKGTAVIEGGKIRYTAGTSFGQIAFAYTVVDELGVSSTGNVNITVSATISQRGLVYAGATGSSASTSLATDKVPLLPGQSSTYANYTNYSKGLNGVVLDVAGLPAATTDVEMLASLQFAQWDGISAAGFTALSSAAVPTVSVLSGVGAGGSTRVLVTFPDNTVQNTWLRIVVAANAQTGLSTNDVFYFGNVIGDFNVGNTTSRIRVNALDSSAVRNNQSPGANSVDVTNFFDVNRDGRVNALDTSIVRNNQQTSGIVAPITAPSALGRSAFGRAGSGALVGEGEASLGAVQMPTDLSSTPSSARDWANKLETVLGPRWTGESYDVLYQDQVHLSKLPGASSEVSARPNEILPETSTKKKRLELDSRFSQFDHYFARFEFESGDDFKS
jgi:Bacterial Ig domain/Dockerin type I domain